jgi:hypothetical protein
VYPLTDVVTQDINLFDPDIQVPYADSWTFGMQRALGRSMAVEVRYVGTRSRENWQTLDYNEINIFENGFLNEFRAAQANLQANIAAGRGATVAFTGAPGTAPLPTFLAFFNGRGASLASDPAAYTGGNWTNSTLQGYLAFRNPDPFGIVEDEILDSATMRRNGVNAGLPENFFVANPDLLGGADFTTNNGRTDDHALQLELRRSLAQGLQFNASYAFGKMRTSSFQTFRRPQFMVRDTGSPGDLTHAFKLNAIYELPFGQGRRFGGNVNGFVDRIIGGWSLSMASRIQSGTLVNLGNVRLVGMSADDVFDMYQLRIDPAGQKVWMLPEDVIDNTIKAFSVSATSPTGYSNLGAPTGRYFAPANGPDCIEVDNGADFGDCGVRELVVTGPMFQQHDVSVGKRVNLFGRSNVEFRLEMLNAFNQHNFSPVGGIGNDIADYEVTGLLGTNSARVVQIVTRINW